MTEPGHRTSVTRVAIAADDSVPDSKGVESGGGTEALGPYVPCLREVQVMLWSKRRSEKSRRKAANRQRHRRALRFEPLEERQVLSGFVDVLLPLVPPISITLQGDGGNNEVEIRQTGNPGEYFITGNSSGTRLSFNGSGMTMPNVTVNGINSDITVRLGSGSDSFSPVSSSTRTACGLYSKNSETPAKT